MKPLLLLDVDGVLCVLGRGPRGERCVEGVVGEMPVRISKETPARLAHLAEHFRLVWATAWEHGANEHLAPLLGLPPLPTILFEDDDPLEPGENYKATAVAAFVGDVPCAWVDDVLSHADHEWARARPAPTLLLETDPRTGLTEDDAEELITWARALTT